MTSKTVEDSVTYIRGVFEDYIRFGEIRLERLPELDVLEVGPGDNLGIALLFLAKGARSVTCIDGFYPKADAAKNAVVYKEVFSRLSACEKSRVAEILPLLSGQKNFSHEKLTVSYGKPIERAFRNSKSSKFNLIISRAVLEHVGDLDSAWSAMIDYLKPDGKMIHKIDFRNHKFFHKVHPLHFLTLPDMFWRLISSPNPTLNRCRMDKYRELSRSSFVDYRIRITSILDNPELPHFPESIQAGKEYSDEDIRLVNCIRKKLIPKFARLNDEDLLVSGVFLTCQTPRRHPLIPQEWAKHTEPTRE